MPNFNLIPNQTNNAQKSNDLLNEIKSVCEKLWNFVIEYKTYIKECDYYSQEKADEFSDFIYLTSERIYRLLENIEASQETQKIYIKIAEKATKNMQDVIDADIKSRSPDYLYHCDLFGMKSAKSFDIIKVLEELEMWTCSAVLNIIYSVESRTFSRIIMED